MKKILFILLLIPVCLFSQGYRENIVRMDSMTSTFLEPYYQGQLVRIVSDSAMYQLDTTVAIGQSMTTVLSHPTWYKKVLTGITPTSTWTLGTNKQTSTVDTVKSTVMDATFVQTPTITMGDASITTLSTAWSVSKADATTGNGASIGLSSGTNPSVTWTANTPTAGNSVDLDTVSLVPSFGVPLNLGKSGTPFDTAFVNKLSVSGYNVTVTDNCSIPLPKGTNLVDGFISSSDWTAFDAKVSSQWTTSGSDIFYNTGKVSIGTTTPTADVHIKGSGYNSASTAFKVDNSVGTNLLTVLNDGKIGVGLTNPTQALSVVGISYASTQLLSGGQVSASGGNADLHQTYLRTYYDGVFDLRNYNTGSNSAMALWTKNVERMRINNSGAVGINTTAPSEKLDVNGEIIAADTLRIGNRTTYSYVIPGGDWVTSSTATVKENITDIQEPADLFTKVLTISPKRYNFKASIFRKAFKLSDIPDSAMVDSVMKKLTMKQRKDMLKEMIGKDSLEALRQAARVHTGFIAEEFNPLVGKSNSKEINYSEVTAMMWKTIQALVRKNQQLEVKVQDQENRIKAVETYLNQTK